MKGQWKFKFEAWDTQGHNLGATICFRGNIKNLEAAKVVARNLYRRLYPKKSKIVRIWDPEGNEVFNSTKRKRNGKSN